MEKIQDTSVDSNYSYALMHIALLLGKYFTNFEETIDYYRGWNTAGKFMLPTSPV